MSNFSQYIQDLQTWANKFPWLEMLSGLGILIFAAFVANFITKQIVVRGIRKILLKMTFATNSILAEHSVIQRFSNIVPALIIMNGIDTVPHLSGDRADLVLGPRRVHRWIHRAVQCTHVVSTELRRIGSDRCVVGPQYVGLQNFSSMVPQKTRSFV